MRDVPHDLADLPELFDDELDRVASIAEVRSDAHAAFLRIVLDVRGLDGSHERRAIECREAVRWRLSDETIYTLEVHDEHPALLAVADDQADLFFTGTPADPSRAADGLRALSARLAGPYLDFDATVNTDAGGLAALLGGGYGRLATGPVTLLRAFGEALERDGVRASLVTTGRASRYLGHETGWTPPPRDLSVLDLGESWVVAESFVCSPD
jgi:hypothetical protein